MKKMNKRGQMRLGDLPNVALTFLLIGIFFALTLVILAALQDNTTVSGNAEANSAIAATITAVAEIPNNWLLIIALVVAAAIVIGVVVTNLGGLNAGGRA
jgi:hypothetical protein